LLPTSAPFGQRRFRLLFQERNIYEEEVALILANLPADDPGLTSVIT